jgi:hypothetical protein
MITCSQLDGLPHKKFYSYLFVGLYPIWTLNKLPQGVSSLGQLHFTANQPYWMAT